MPTYEYFCEKCGVFEEFHGINTVLTECPKCSSSIHRLISKNSNIIFKGSGFYVTDSRAAEHHQTTASENNRSADSVSSKSDSKAS